MEHPFEKFKYCPKCGSTHFIEANDKAKHCEDCGFTYYFNAAAATVALILNDKKELLVCRRANNPAKGTLDLPGGFIDPDETAEEGVAREVKEETGLEVLSTRYLFSLPNQYLFSDFNVHTLDLFFLCTVKELSHYKAMDDAAELKFVPLSQITTDEFGLFSIRQGLERFLLMNSASFTPTCEQ